MLDHRRKHAINTSNNCYACNKSQALTEVIRAYESFILSIYKDADLKNIRENFKEE